ncbi:prolyl oligopeptidase family serine peptidase [Nocardiopsis ganjiahuensis]|uniref:prolyl oligopeptidase family serine peptidase n=1 Tax=Nocardiopsis ganjiahuensis TaxID=239984 RepID=UPI00034A191B|nr:prolyl oligopeptidase family serine peptidase [Nocardiopsis ganjiahuensis]
MNSPISSSFSDFTDTNAFTRIPRVSALAAGPGGRVVASVAESDEHGSKLDSALWALDPEGLAPARRLTFSEEGESAPRFAPDGSLLFSSRRPDPDSEAKGAAAVWRLPEHGEAGPVAWTPGGLSVCGVADDGSVLATTSVLVGATLDNDAERRQARKDAKRSTIWHTGMPIRHWDHELGDVSPRLVLAAPDGDIRDLTEGADTVALTGASADLSPDGGTVATTWTERVGGGQTRTGVALIDTGSRKRTTLLAADDDQEYGSPLFSPDGTLLAVKRTTVSTPTDTAYGFLEVHPLEGGGPVVVDVGDLTVKEYVWSHDGTLLVAGDLHSSGAVLAVDPHTGRVRTVAEGSVFTSLAPAPDGSVYALRSDLTTPPRPVRLSPAGEQRELPAPGAVGALPGAPERVRIEVGGVPVNGWLCLPDGASGADPAPVMLWIHGGPHTSFNTWNWRWCPWLAVARGYAVLMPDPAMSTGYGHAGLNRGWPRLPDVVFGECEALLDEVLERPELDGSRTAVLGASFGGFMTNWIAGHSDRFSAVVTHAGLWALDQQHRTTDAAAHKTRVHGHEDDLPEWYRNYSPHHSAERVTTPVLITHGNRDYRVPISEALRMWWDLVSGWDGPPETMPHRFLQLTGENHWVLAPSNSRVWNETVLAFCDQHLLGADPVPEVLPW